MTEKEPLIEEERSLDQAWHVGDPILEWAGRAEGMIEDED